jgi:SAM-dependent methyltransferase
MIKSNSLNFFNWQFLKKMKLKINWYLVLLVLIIIWLLCFIYNFNRPTSEGFINLKNHIVKKDQEVYDGFYANIYDKLFYAEFKTDYEIGEITKLFKTRQNELVLDVGSGTGHNVEKFREMKIEAVGVDNSAAMVKQSKTNYPHNKYIKGNILTSNLFPMNKFNLITCLYFTIYYIEDKALLFQNCYNWLKPNGVLVINLVNRDNFDPVIPPSSPFYVNPQGVASKRITNSNVSFDNMKYKSNFKLEGSKGNFIEKFTDNKGSVRENHHTLYMEKQNEILGLAKKMGFIYVAKINLDVIEYNFQYLYVLKKPN